MTDQEIEAELYSPINLLSELEIKLDKSGVVVAYREVDGISYLYGMLQTVEQFEAQFEAELIQRSN